MPSESRRRRRGRLARALFPRGRLGGRERQRYLRRHLAGGAISCSARVVAAPAIPVFAAVFPLRYLLSRLPAAISGQQCERRKELTCLLLPLPVGSRCRRCCTDVEPASAPPIVGGDKHGARYGGNGCHRYSKSIVRHARGGEGGGLPKRRRCSARWRLAIQLSAGGLRPLGRSDQRRLFSQI